MARPQRSSRSHLITRAVVTSQKACVEKQPWLVNQAGDLVGVVVTFQGELQALASVSLGLLLFGWIGWERWYLFFQAWSCDNLTSIQLKVINFTHQLLGFFWSLPWLSSCLFQHHAESIISAATHFLCGAPVWPPAGVGYGAHATCPVRLG